MKKLKLKLQSVEGMEVLTRAQLKNVFGGTSAPGGTCGHSGGCAENEYCQFYEGMSYGYCVEVGGSDDGSGSGTTSCADLPHTEQCAGSHSGCCTNGSCTEGAGGYHCV